MRQAHSAPWGGKGRPRDRAAQVVIGVSMAAGKVWASPNTVHLIHFHGILF